MSGEAAAAVKMKHPQARKRRAMSAAGFGGAAPLPLVTTHRHPALTAHGGSVTQTEVCEGRAPGRGEGTTAAPAQHSRTIPVSLAPSSSCRAALQ